MFVSKGNEVLKDSGQKAKDAEKAIEKKAEEKEKPGG